MYSPRGPSHTDMHHLPLKGPLSEMSAGTRGSFGALLTLLGSAKEMALSMCTASSARAGFACTAHSGARGLHTSFRQQHHV